MSLRDELDAALAKNAIADPAVVAAARALLADVAECGQYNTVGSRCVQPVGHDGEHRSKWKAVWTDASNEQAAEWMKRNA